MSRPSRFFFRSAAAMWITITVGHLVLVDALTLHGRTRASEFVPHRDLLNTMEMTTVDFGPLGANTAFRIMAGFSLWLALALAFLGLTFLILSKQYDIELGRFTRLGVVISGTFFAISVACFIIPPAVASGLATALFVTSWIRKEG